MVRACGEAEGGQVFASEGLSGVDERAARSWGPGRDITEQVADKPVGGGIRFAATGDIHLAKDHESLALAVFEQGAVLEAVAAVEDRKKVASDGFLNQHGGDVPPVATAPKPGHGEVTPKDGGAVARFQFVGQPGREQR